MTFKIQATIDKWNHIQLRGFHTGNKGTIKRMEENEQGKEIINSMKRSLVGQEKVSTDYLYGKELIFRIPPLGISKGSEISLSKNNLHSYIYWNAFIIAKIWDQLCVSINRWLDKAAYGTYRRILEKICRSIKFKDKCAKNVKSLHIFLIFISMNFLKNPYKNFIQKKTISSFVM